MKKTRSILLALVLCLGLLTSFVSAAGFPFADVPTYEWYFDDVKNAYDMDLINGKTANTFAPNDYLTYAEAVKLAACMHQRYESGAVTLTNGEPWYQSYVDYCKENGIIARDYSWNTNATRAGYMEIFSNALPKAALAGINEVADGSIPDVSMSHPQAAAIYKLYRAGILQGNDAAHNCSPSSNIKRSEVAAILTRMMDSAERIRFSMGAAEELPEKDPEQEEETVLPLKIKEQPVSVTGKSGEEVILETWIEGGELPYTYTWLVGSGSNAAVLDGQDGIWISGGSRSASGSFFSKLHVTLPAGNGIVGDDIYCVIEDAAGQEVATKKVTVTMEQAAEPLKVKTSSDVTVEPGETAELSISVTGGTAPYKYRWEMYVTDSSRKIWVDAGISSSVMTVRIPPAHPGGSQVYRCVVTDAAGESITGDTVRVTVEAAAPLTLTNNRMASGDLVDLVVYAEGGTAPYTFTWQGWDSKYGPTTYVTQWNGITVATGTTSSMLTVNTIKCSCTRYLCTVRDADGTAQTIEFTIG